MTQMRFEVRNEDGQVISSHDTAEQAQAAAQRLRLDRETSSASTCYGVFPVPTSAPCAKDVPFTVDPREAFRELVIAAEAAGWDVGENKAVLQAARDGLAAMPRTATVALTPDEERRVAALAREALDAACLTIQKKLNQPDGGVAGQFFDGSAAGAAVEALFVKYIKAEIADAEEREPPLLPVPRFESDDAEAYEPEWWEGFEAFERGEGLERARLTYPAAVHADRCGLWVNGWWNAYARCMAQGALDAFKHEREATDAVSPYPMFTGAWEAWATGYDHAFELSGEKR